MFNKTKTIEELTIEYRSKILDIEEVTNRIKTINQLFIPYANENSPEASIIAELLSKELDEMYEALRQ